MKSIVLLLTCVISGAVSAYGEQVDDILDRLEKKLLEAKQESLLLNDNWNKPLVRPDTKKVEVTKKEIIGTLPSQDDLQDIGTAIDKVDREVERLSADVEKLKRIIAADSRNDSLVNVYIEVAEPSHTSLREMTVALDDFTIYKLNPDVGLWLPRSKVPVFSGPLSPGKHSIALSGRMAKVLENNIPIDDNTFHLFDQKFPISIPQGNVRKEITIKLEPVKDKNFKAKAVLVETNN